MLVLSEFERGRKIIADADDGPWHVFIIMGTA
jgi:hypothetical protein